MKRSFNHTNKNVQKDQDHVLVYSTDPLPVKTCEKCKKPETGCECNSLSAQDIKKIKPQVRIEKKGRGGKVVTLLYRLPESEKFLKDFCKYLKTVFGSGGTYYNKESEGIIEIQGDWQKDILEAAQKYLAK